MAVSPRTVAFCCLSLGTAVSFWNSLFSLLWMPGKQPQMLWVQEWTENINQQDKDKETKKSEKAFLENNDKHIITVNIELLNSRVM